MTPEINRITAEITAKAEVEQEVRQFWWNVIRWSVLVGLLMVVASMWGCPQYHVYKQRMDGEATLAQSHSARQVQVVQAEAERDAARLRAEAIAIVGEAAKQYPEYRQQEFIGAFAEAMHNGRINQIIYVPTEAGIPILERRPAPK